METWWTRLGGVSHLLGGRKEKADDSLSQQDRSVIGTTAAFDRTALREVHRLTELPKKESILLLGHEYCNLIQRHVM